MSVNSFLAQFGGILIYFCTVPYIMCMLLSVAIYNSKRMMVFIFHTFIFMILAQELKHFFEEHGNTINVEQKTQDPNESQLRRELLRPLRPKEGPHPFSWQGVQPNMMLRKPMYPPPLRMPHHPPLMRPPPQQLPARQPPPLIKITSNNALQVTLSVEIYQRISPCITVIGIVFIGIIVIVIVIFNIVSACCQDMLIIFICISDIANLRIFGFEFPGGIGD